jgi:hypothetical protein
MIILVFMPSMMQKSFGALEDAETNARDNYLQHKHKTK